jgi:hypothetical protein
MYARDFAAEGVTEHAYGLFAQVLCELFQVAGRGRDRVGRVESLGRAMLSQVDQPNAPLGTLLHEPPRYTGPVASRAEDTMQDVEELRRRRLLGFDG